MNHTLTRYALASLAGLLAQALFLALMRLDNLFQPGPLLWLILILDVLAWLLLVALPTGALGEEFLRRQPRFPARLMLPLVGLLQFTITVATCGGSALVVQSFPNAAPASTFTAGILTYALADGLSGIVFWWTLSATRPNLPH